MPRPKVGNIDEFSSVKRIDSLFSERLSTLIKQKRKDVSKAKICEDLNITKRTLELWEIRQSRPDIDRLCTLADYFGVTVDYLVGRSDTKAPTLDEAAILEKYGLSIPGLNNLDVINKRRKEKTPKNFKSENEKNNFMANTHMANMVIKAVNILLENEPKTHTLMKIGRYLWDKHSTPKKVMRHETGKIGTQIVIKNDYADIEDYVDTEHIYLIYINSLQEDLIKLRKETQKEAIDNDKENK